MGEFEIWTYRSVIGALLVVIWYFAKGILGQLKEMNITLRSLNDKGLVHDGKIELVQGQVNTHETRLNDHSIKIRGIERKQDVCQYCREA
jgi:hypothetical protein